MKQLLLGFILGVRVCMSIGATVYHPIKGVVVYARYGANSHNFKTVMENQEAIYQLIEDRCKSGATNE